MRIMVKKENDYKVGDNSNFAKLSLKHTAIIFKILQLILTRNNYLNLTPDKINKMLKNGIIKCNSDCICISVDKVILL